ncbi:hypothetical protein V6N13_071746 [Hibiscus sabdariffa]
MLEPEVRPFQLNRVTMRVDWNGSGTALPPFTSQSYHRRRHSVLANPKTSVASPFPIFFSDDPTRTSMEIVQ